MKMQLLKTNKIGQISVHNTSVLYFVTWINPMYELILQFHTSYYHAWSTVHPRKVPTDTAFFLWLLTVLVKI
jgi:hypothetical protein